MLDKVLVCVCFVAMAACGKGDAGGDKPAPAPAPTPVPTAKPTAPAGPPRWDAPTHGGCLRQGADSTCVMYIGESFANAGEAACRAVRLASPLYAGERCPDRFKLPGLCAMAAGTDQETHVAYYDLQLTLEAAQKACADGGGVWKP